MFVSVEDSYNDCTYSLNVNLLTDRSAHVSLRAMCLHEGKVVEVVHAGTTDASHNWRSYLSVQLSKESHSFQ